MSVDRDEAIDLGRFAARWIADDARPAIDGAAVARSALLAGLPLEAAPTPYGTPAQRRAFACGALRGSIYAMRQAYRQADLDRAAADREAALLKKVAMSTRLSLVGSGHA